MTALDNVRALQVEIAQLKYERDCWAALAAAADADRRKAEAIAAEQAGEIERLRAELASRPKQWWLPWAPVEAARRMHLAYEHFASDFGYETRTDTKVWNPDSANGQLMVAVIRNVFIEQASDAALKEQK
jgi:FtsZ-binding cell division protein ZapB